MTTKSSTKLIGGDRPLRGCDVCGGVDDHPRHAIAGPPGAAGNPLPDVVNLTLDNLGDATPEDRARIMGALFDTSSQDRHRDCCRAVGCPSGTCNDVADLGGEDLRGAELLALTEDNADELQALADARTPNQGA